MRLWLQIVENSNYGLASAYGEYLVVDQDDCIEWDGTLVECAEYIDRTIATEEANYIKEQQL
jgi:hypothetical protein